MSLSSLLRDERGATAIEYALIAVLIAIAAIVAMQGVGNEMTLMFETVGSDLKDANTP